MVSDESRGNISCDLSDIGNWNWCVANEWNYWLDVGGTVLFFSNLDNLGVGVADDLTGSSFFSVNVADGNMLTSFIRSISNNSC